VAKPIEVTLNVYDLGTSSAIRALNRVLRDLGSGAFHCGVELCGHEWSYGHCGIFSSPPRSCMGHNFSEAVSMGLAFLSRKEVLALVRFLERDWPGSKYDLVKQNCCQFANAFCQRLGLGSIPPWVTRLAGAGRAMGGFTETFGLGTCCCVDRPGAEASLGGFPVAVDCNPEGWNDEEVEAVWNGHPWCAKPLSPTSRRQMPGRVLARGDGSRSAEGVVRRALPRHGRA